MTVKRLILQWLEMGFFFFVISSSIIVAAVICRQISVWILDACYGSTTFREMRRSGYNWPVIALLAFIWVAPIAGAAAYYWLTH